MYGVWIWISQCKLNNDIVIKKYWFIFLKKILMSQCNLDMLKTDGSVPTMNLFKQVDESQHHLKALFISQIFNQISIALLPILNFQPDWLIESGNICAETNQGLVADVCKRRKWRAHAARKGQFLTFLRHFFLNWTSWISCQLIL